MTRPGTDALNAGARDVLLDHVVLEAGDRRVDGRARPGMALAVLRHLVASRTRCSDAEVTSLARRQVLQRILAVEGAALSSRAAIPASSTWA